MPGTVHLGQFDERVRDVILENAGTTIAFHVGRARCQGPGAGVPTAHRRSGPYRPAKPQRIPSAHDKWPDRAAVQRADGATVMGSEGAALALQRIPFKTDCSLWIHPAAFHDIASIVQQAASG